MGIPRMNARISRIVLHATRGRLLRSMYGIMFGQNTNTPFGKAGSREWNYQRIARRRKRAEDEDENKENLLLAMRLKKLPASVSEYYSSLGEDYGRACGSKDKTTPIVPLCDDERTREIISTLPNPMADHVRLTIPAGLVGNGFGRRMRFVYGRDGDENWTRRTLDPQDTVFSPISKGSQKDGYVAFSRCGRVEFPKPNNRNVNMMPFLLGKKESLPQDLQCYHDLIQACPYVQEEIGNVAYLTVEESYVDANQSQRRGGLHTESPGFFKDSTCDTAASFLPGLEHPWGMGFFSGPDHYEGGIYFASNRDDTSEVWDALVDSSVPGIVDHGGGCEYIRQWIGEGTKLKAGELVWMTDRTPHEALPQVTSGHRQFFRLVMPHVSHWYADHSTPNIPLPAHVKVIHGNKLLRKGIVESVARIVDSIARIRKSVVPGHPNEDPDTSRIVFSTPEVRTAFYAESTKRERQTSD